MSLLTSMALRRIEAKYSEGIRAVAVVKIFQDRGEKFSEATLRKYVQLGLLPTSRRVGIRGKHRGSSGLYPVAIVRMANAIKAALAHGSTLQDIRHSTLGLAGDIAHVRRALRALGARLAATLGARSPGRRQIAGHVRALERELRALERAIDGLGPRN